MGIILNHTMKKLFFLILILFAACAPEANETNTDTDNDGIFDVDDNCPLVVNPDQLDSNNDGIGDACSGDTDEDGIIDALDNCVFIQNPNQEDENDDGIGDACSDLDEDGLLDSEDNCPLNSNPNQEDENNDGIGDACSDLDDDGIIDGDDNCPLFANPNQSDSDGDNIGDTCDATALFDSSETSIYIGDQVSFLSTSTGSINFHEWTLEGGNPNTSNETSLDVTYNSIGNFDVSLYVSNGVYEDTYNAENFVNVCYNKSFENNQWNDWISNGWAFSSSTTCPDCIYAWQNSTSPGESIEYDLCSSFNDLPNNSTLYFEAMGDGTFELLERLSSKINNVEVDVETIEPAGLTSLGTYSVSIPNNLNTVDICVVATLFYTNNIYLNNLTICEN